MKEVITRVRCNSCNTVINSCAGKYWHVENDFTEDYDMDFCSTSCMLIFLEGHIKDISEPGDQLKLHLHRKLVTW